MSDPLHAFLEHRKMKVFATQQSTEEALKYAIDLLNEAAPARVTAAIMVYHNSLLNALQNELLMEAKSQASGENNVPTKH